MTDEELLAEYAHEADGGWYLKDKDGKPKPGFPRDRDSMLAVIKFCLFLGQPVTDILTGNAVFAITEHLRKLSERVAALEAGPAHWSRI